MEVLSFGRSATSDTEAELQIGGRHLLYHVLLCGEIRLAVALMDGVQCPENILRSPDTPAGWDVLDRLIRSMETYETADLSRPICVGNPAVDDPRSLGDSMKVQVAEPQSKDRGGPSGATSTDVKCPYFGGGPSSHSA